MLLSTRAQAEAFKSIWGFYPISGGDASAEVPNGGGAPPAGAPPAGAPPAAPEFGTLVPAEYKDAPWVKETKDIPALFKRTNDLITEIGKRPAGIPQDNAKPEEVAAFNKAFGVPEKAEAYVFSDPPKELGAANPEFQTAMKSMFHKNGISAKQAAGLQKDWDAYQLETLKKSGADGDKQDADFDKLKAATFGARADEAIKGANALIGKFVPENMKPHIAKLSNENLIVLAGVLDGIRKEYISEDRMPTGGGAPAGMTTEQKREKGLQLMASKPYIDPFHPEHEKVKAEVAALYGTA